jgi:pSer/pThr/pTyr-binding forkhead associated (FHA) protein
VPTKAPAASEYLEELRAAVHAMTRERFEARYPWCFLGVMPPGTDMTIQYTTRSARVDFDAPIKGTPLVDLIPMTKTSAYSGPTSLVVGRSRACDLWLNDASVSKTHARFTLVKQRPVALTDLGSRNKTHLNGEPLTPQIAVDVRMGDDILFGSVPVRLLEARDLHALL